MAVLVSQREIPRNGVTTSLKVHNGGALAEDRRIARSKKALRQALIELIEERGVDGFTVNDLCTYADLNRGTFYNHFHDKDEFLLSLEDEIIDDLEGFRVQLTRLSFADLVRYRLNSQPLPFLVDLFDYLREQGDFLHAVMGAGGDGRFSLRLRDAVCTNLIRSVLHERYRNNPTPFVDYYISFYASAYLGVITRWIENGMNESSETMARIAMRLFFIKPGESIEL